MIHPKPLSRREVFQTATLLGVGAAVLSTGAASGAEAVPFAAGSGLVTGTPKKLKYEEIPDCSPRLRSRRTIRPTTAARSSVTSPSRSGSARWSGGPRSSRRVAWRRPAEA